MAHLVRHGLGVRSRCRGLPVLNVGRPRDRLRAMGLVSDVFRVPDVGRRTRGERDGFGWQILGRAHVSREPLAGAVVAALVHRGFDRFQISRFSTPRALSADNIPPTSTTLVFTIRLLEMASD
jgi:hypothetical protein